VAHARCRPCEAPDWELEEWLLDAGERGELKAVAGEPVTPAERLIREFWAFDVHTRNGGVSQYFELWADAVAGA
jgi:hypothetical protein